MRVSAAKRALPRVERGVAVEAQVIKVLEDVELRNVRCGRGARCLEVDVAIEQSVVGCIVQVARTAVLAMVVSAKPPLPEAN